MQIKDAVDATVHFSSGRVVLIPINELMENPKTMFAGQGGRYFLVCADTCFEVTYALNDGNGEYVVVIPYDNRQVVNALKTVFNVMIVPYVSISEKTGIVSEW